jgi:hypothetical protein
MSEDAGAVVYTAGIKTSAGALTLDGAAGVNIAGNAAEIDVTTTGAVDINGAAITVNATSGISLDAAAASNFTTSAGALTLNCAGGVDITSTLDVTGVTNINNTTTSTNSTTGALVVDGGVGIAGNLNVGGAIDVTHAATTRNNLGIYSFRYTLITGSNSSRIDIDLTELIFNGQLPSGYSFTGLEMITATANTDGTGAISSIYPFDKDLDPSSILEVLRIDTVGSGGLSTNDIITITIIVP